jgi:hypothetical protein
MGGSDRRIRDEFVVVYFAAVQYARVMPGRRPHFFG